MGKKLKLKYSEPELEKIRTVIHLLPFEKEVFELLVDDTERYVMADTLNASLSTIQRAIKSIGEKIKDAIDKDLL